MVVKDDQINVTVYSGKNITKQAKGKSTSSSKRHIQMDSFCHEWYIMYQQLYGIHNLQSSIVFCHGFSKN